MKKETTRGHVAARYMVIPKLYSAALSCVHARDKVNSEVKRISAEVNSKMKET